MNHYAIVKLKKISLPHAILPAFFADMLVGVSLGGNIM